MAKGAHCRSQHSHSGVSGGGQWLEKLLCWFAFLSGFILFYTISKASGRDSFPRESCVSWWLTHPFGLALQERVTASLCSFFKRKMPMRQEPHKLGLLEPDIAGYQLITCLKVQDGPWGQGCDLGMTWILFLYHRILSSRCRLYRLSCTRESLNPKSIKA